MDGGFVSAYSGTSAAQPAWLKNRPEGPSVLVRPWLSVEIWAGILTVAERRSVSNSRGMFGIHQSGQMF